MEEIIDDAEVICDVDKARLLLKIVTESNPKHPPGWIAAARLEKADRKIQAARQLIQIGCEECPENEDVWLEACRLAANLGEAKEAIKKGLNSIPNSLKLWLVLARLETYYKSKMVLCKARVMCPKEPAIWITAAKLEEANGKILNAGKIIERGIRALQSEGVVINKEEWIKEAEAAERAGSVATCQAMIKHTIGIVEVDEDLQEENLRYCC